MFIFSYCFESHQTHAHPFRHGLIFFSRAIHFRSRPCDVSQHFLQNFPPRTDGFIWAVDKVFCISSSCFVVLLLPQIFFRNLLATILIPCQLLFRIDCFLHCRSTCLTQVLHLLFHPMQRSHDEEKKKLVCLTHLFAPTL